MPSMPKPQSLQDLPLDLRALVEDLGVMAHHAVAVFWEHANDLEADPIEGELKALGELTDLSSLKVGHDVVQVHVVEVVLEGVLQCFSQKE